MRKIWEKGGSGDKRKGLVSMQPPHVFRARFLKLCFPHNLGA